jgi:hypothetical protein
MENIQASLCFRCKKGTISPKRPRKPPASLGIKIVAAGIPTSPNSSRMIVSRCVSEGVRLGLASHN